MGDLFEERVAEARRRDEAAKQEAAKRGDPAWREEIFLRAHRLVSKLRPAGASVDGGHVLAVARFLAGE